VEYITKIYEDPQRFSGYVLRTIEGSLGQVGSSHVEQNHSSIVSILGNGASWKLEDQIHKLVCRQDLLQTRKNERRVDYEVKICRDYKSQLGEPSTSTDDEQARASLTKWAYETLWMKSYKHSTFMEAKQCDDGSTIVRDSQKEWDDNSTVILTGSMRCSCRKRVAFGVQCAHEYLRDGSFRLDRYDKRSG
jgi:hypothetical protein